jgi:SAM-dependent methyltransferase
MKCWICASERLNAFKASNLPAALKPEDFRITDSHYGRTGALVRCAACGFIQTTENFSALGFYEQMDDEGYEETRGERSVQFRRLLERLRRWAPSGRLLDIGAGSGALVEEALKLGFKAEGVEPSGWLADRAKKRGLPVHHCALPHASVRGPFDVVTLVDVIEHVMDPMALISAAAGVLAPDGMILVITPDVSSVVPRLLGRRWWHFRIAHVGYFNPSNLDRAFLTHGFVPADFYRPAWHFPVQYLFERTKRYLPIPRKWKLPDVIGARTIPLNLLDSMAVLYRRKK